MPAWSLALLIFLLALAGLFAMLRQSFRARTRGFRAALGAMPVATRAPRPVPPEILALARRGGASEDAPARLIELTQRCEIRGKPGDRWRRLEATQLIAVGAPGFLWEAAGAGVRVIDAYAGGAGLLEARLLGALPAMRAEGAEIDRGELMRWLAELPFAPDAMIRAEGLRWTVAAPDRLEVSAGDGDAAATVTLLLDAAGDVAAAEAPDRPRLEDDRPVPRPWRGTFSDHAEIGGRRVPLRAEASWLLPEGAFVYWRGEITGLRVLP